MSNTSLKDYSRKNWNPYSDGKPSSSEIDTGCLQRIADAVEQIAVNTSGMNRKLEDLERNLAYYKSLAESRLERLQKLEHSVAGHKAAYTKLKRKTSGINQSSSETGAEGEISQ